VRENAGGRFDGAFIGNFTKTSYTVPSKRVYFGSAFKADPTLIGQALFLEPSQVQPVTSYLASHPSEELSFDMPFTSSTGGGPVTAAPYPPASGSALSAVVLTGPSCVSACDLFVAPIRNNGIAKLAGMSPAAADSPIRYWAKLRLADGE